MTTYSFSRLSSWDTCKRAWKNNYIEGDRGEDNFFSRFGTLAHSVLEKVDLKEISPEYAFTEWEDRYPSEVGLPHEIPWMDNWKKEADNFFKTFKGFNTEAKWVEQHVLLQRDNYLFQGYVDRLGLSSTNGNLILTDYKCAKPYEGAKLKEKARQLYLYSTAVKEEFGKFPERLIFFHFRQKLPLIVPFKVEDYIEAWDWADKMVSEIESYSGDYPMKDNGYFCNAVCGYRNTCTKQFEK